jgi:hypothetical protein
MHDPWPRVGVPMSGLRNTIKGGWHPEGKEGGKESWRGDFKGINQVADLGSAGMQMLSGWGAVTTIVPTLSRVNCTYICSNCNMSGLRNTIKGGWHPEGKEGGKESWRGDFKGINHADAKWLGSCDDNSPHFVTCKLYLHM